MSAFQTPRTVPPGRLATVPDQRRDNSFTRLASAEPGFWQRRQLRHEQGAAIADIRRAEIKAVREEVTAIFIAGAKHIGAECRAEQMRSHAQALTATVNEAMRDFHAHAQEQDAIATAASFCNLRSLAEGRKELQCLAGDLPVDDQELQAQLVKLQARHAKTEARFDRASDLAADLVDQNFLLGVAPSKFIVEQQ